MLRASPAGLLNRLVPVLPVALLFLYGCSDAPLPVEPRVPARPHALVGPTVTVTNTDDAGVGSLRQAIIDAPDGATIQFDAGIAGGTIVLSTGSLGIGKALTIEGPVPAGMTISGGLSSRVFGVGSSANVVFRNLSIVNGREKFGGGLEVNGNATLDHSLVANNETFFGDGGGIFLRDGGELALVNSTVSGNVSLGIGGGVASFGTISIRNSTIAFNSAADGGGVSASDGSFTARNSIIANNIDLAAPIARNCFIDPVVSVSFVGRNIANDASCGDDPPIRIANPNLFPLANNGGPTKTHAIAFGPSVDAGALCTEATDQRYVARNQGLSCDVGAFEFNDYGTVTLTLNPNAAVNAKTGVATLTGTIKCSASTEVVLDVGTSQTQKITGRFTAIIQAQGTVSVPACGTSPSSWSVALTPATGKFEPGTATGTASSAPLATAFLPANVTAPLKLFQVK